MFSDGDLCIICSLNFNMTQKKKTPRKNITDTEKCTKSSVPISVFVLQLKIRKMDNEHLYPILYPKWRGEKAQIFLCCFWAQKNGHF